MGKGLFLKINNLLRKRTNPLHNRRIGVFQLLKAFKDHWLPVILFLLSGLMAFSTGTSWGTFGIMLPIAGDMAGATDIALMLPMLSAVLAGSVFGDHCSPISDTTILSSTGARCNHIDHVSTQLPYALATALVSCVGFVVLGMTASVLISFSAASVAFVVVCLVLASLSRSKITNYENA